MTLATVCRALLEFFRKHEEEFQLVVLDNGFLSVQATNGAAGYDIRAKVTSVVPPGELVAIPLGISIRPPQGTYTRTVLRSSFARRHSAVVSADVVDADYTGEIHCFVRNIGNINIEIDRGERFCQLVFVRHSNPRPVVVASLPLTERGQHGQGSTGKY